MKTTAAVILALMSFGASAQGFGAAEPTCYSWNGGYKSSGSFSKCNPDLRPAQPKPRIVAQPIAPLPAPVLQSPILMPQSAPAPKPVVKRKPKPKMICRPA